MQLSELAQRIKQEFTVWRVGIIPGFIIIFLIILARSTGSLQYFEWMAFDNFLRLRPTENSDKRIVIIGINEADIRQVGKYPIPDRELAILLRKIQSYQPRVIGLDIFRDIPQEPGHTELVNTFKDINNLVAIDKVLPETVAAPPSLSPEKVGFADAIIDTDGKLRRSLLGTPTDQGYKLSLTIKLAKAYLASEKIILENGIYDYDAMRFGRVELPRIFPNTGGYVQTNAGGVQVLLNYRSGQNQFTTLSLQDIKNNNFHPNLLRDKIVLVGMTAHSAKDIINTSAIVSQELEPGKVYGVKIQAHAISQILSAVLDNRPLLKSWGEGWEYIWIIMWGGLGICLAKLTASPLKNLGAVVVASCSVTLICYLLINVGWWVPVIPNLIVLVVNGVGLTALYEYDRSFRGRIAERQLTIERTFTTIHNGPLQTLATILQRVREGDANSEKMLLDLESLNFELRAIYEYLQQETLANEENIYLGSSHLVNLRTPLHEVLYQVYSNTLERDLPYFKTLKVKIRTFDPVEDSYLSVEQKQGICRFLEEALCNVGKHAVGVTRLQVTYTEKDGWYMLTIKDNGVGIDVIKAGRGTQQSQNLAKQLRGKFERYSLSPRGTLCQLSWRKRRFWFW